MCQENMVVKALAEDIEPHYTTISNFVSGMSEGIEKVFSEVLLVCASMGLIMGKLFAIDGCRLPSNASKEWSGTKKELRKKYERIKRISKEIVKVHRYYGGANTVRSYRHPRKTPVSLNSTSCRSSDSPALPPNYFQKTFANMLNSGIKSIFPRQFNSHRLLNCISLIKKESLKEITIFLMVISFSDSFSFSGREN